MEQRARNTLEMFFQNLCQSHYLLSRDTQADISIIDMDTAHSRKIYQEHRERYPDRPTLLVSLIEIEPENDNELFLAKPILPEQLLVSLEDLNRRSHNGTARPEPLQVGTEHTKDEPNAEQTERPPLPPVLDVVVPALRHGPEHPLKTPGGEDAKNPDPADAGGEIIHLFPASRSAGPAATQPDDMSPHQPDREKQKASFIYDPDNCLQGYVQEAYRIARQKNRCVSLKGPWRPIVLLPESREIWVEQSHAHLYALSNMAIQAEDVTVTCLEPEWSPPEQGGSLLPIDHFLWKLAVRTARGRIPAGTDLRAPVYLRHWPNLSRLLPVQHGLRIAALWTRHPVSLMEAATILNIPPKYLFSFYSAASTIGLIGHQAKNEDNHEPPPPPLPQQHEHQGLFRKILSRLRGRGR